MRCIWKTASAVHAVYLEARVRAGRGLRRCYRDRGVSVAAARAASAVHAVRLEDRVEAGRGLRRCYRGIAVFL